MNIHRIQNYLTLTLDDGTILTTDELTDELFSKILSNIDNVEAIKALINPKYQTVKALLEKVNKSKYLALRGNSVYLPDISELSLPIDFIEKFIEAEEQNDIDKLTAYRNFWLLLSLNPDSRVRNNTFWFINKWDIKITKSGLLVCYRNADIKTEGSKFNHALTEFVTTKYWEKKHSANDSPNGYIVVSKSEDNDFAVVSESYDFKSDNLVYIGDLIDLYETITNSNNLTTTTYTDHHSHTFNIKLGHIVSMPREKVDSCQENTCSKGLHCASKDWLEQNYFGTVGMKVLVNPADVCAIPPQDSYGKMRTCAYYPVSIVKYNSEGHIIDDGIEDGYEDDFIEKICYTGTINNEDHDNYRIEIPESNELHKSQIYARLKELALSSIANRGYISEK